MPASELHASPHEEAKKQIEGEYEEVNSDEDSSQSEENLNESDIKK